LGADRASPAISGLRIVELFLQRAHQATAVGAEELHRALLGAAQRGDSRVPVRVVPPVRALQNRPARTLPPDRPLDVEDLQHRFEPALAEVDRRHQLLGAAPVGARRAQLLEHGVYAFLRGERLLDEEVLNAAILDAAQQDDVGVLDGAARSSDLLVVGDDRPGRLVVDDEPEVRLVVAHPQGTRGNDRLDLVRQQALLRADPQIVLLLAAVRDRAYPLSVQELRDLLGVTPRERVDDPGARWSGQVLGQPGQTLRGASQDEDLNPQA